jgi:outer membrane protein assembly factor BamD
MRRLYGSVAAAALCMALAGCSYFGKEVDPTRDWSAQRLYEEGRAALNGGDYETAIKHFERLDTRFPFGPYAEQAQIEIIYAYYKYDEPASAVAAADRFVKLHPTHSHADYAYYLKGLTYFNQGKGFVDRLIPRDESQRDPSTALQSFQSFSELVKRFPDSKYARDATQRMLFLRNILAKHEVNVAEYYMKRGAYVAAANRAKYVIENYQRTPAVPDALVLMAKAYRLMKLDELAQDALRVLKLNYPDHPGIRELERLAGK